MLGPDEFRKINEVFLFVLIVCRVVFGDFLMVFLGVVVGITTRWCMGNRRAPTAFLLNEKINKN
jgi:hypothetical protein